MKPLTKEIFKKRLKLLPPTFEIYITNQCNLNCDYCSSKKIKSFVKTTPSFEMIKSAVDIFAFHTNPETVKKFGLKDDNIRAIGFTGAEPLMEFDTLIKSAKYIRKKYPWLILNISTNATLIDKKKVSLIESLGINMSVSMDGIKEINDKHRKFRDKPDISVWETVNNNFRKLSKKSIKSMGAITTFTPQTMHTAVDTAEALSQIGFGSVSMNLDVYGNWNAEKTEKLRKVLKVFKQKHLKQIISNIRSGNNISDCFFEFHPENSDKSRYFLKPPEMTLSPDGYFYPCDVLCVHSAKQYRAGDFKAGIDFKKFEKTYLEASKFLAEYPHSNNVLSAMARYYHALITGKSIRKSIENAERIGKLFHEELGDIIEIENIFNKLNRHPHFGDFAHQPRHICANEIKEIKIEISGCDISRARESVDFFLYSPGKTKSLFLSAKNEDKNIQDIKSICAYSICKAEYIKKNLLIYIESSSSVPNKSLESFLIAHKIKFGAIFNTKTSALNDKLKKAGLFYGIVRIDSKNILNLSRIIKKCFSSNDQPLKLSLSNRFSWKNKDIVKLKNELKKIRPLILKHFLASNNHCLLNFNDLFKTNDFSRNIIINSRGDLIYSSSLISPKKEPVKVRDFNNLFKTYYQNCAASNTNAKLNNEQKAADLFSKWTSQMSKEIEYLKNGKSFQTEKRNSINPNNQSRLFAGIRKPFTFVAGL